MTLTFFADHCVSNTIIETLRNTGHEVLRLKDHLPTNAPDPVVISKAQELDAILISLNGDFADIVRYPSDKYKGIVALQVRNRPEAIGHIMRKLTDFLLSHPEKNYYEGKILLVEAHRIRVRG